MEVSSNRSNTLDIAKGIAIILMVIGHCYCSENSLLILIYSFHMPLFFIVSGIIYGHKCETDSGYKFNILKNAKRMAIPYFVYGVAFSCFLAFLQSIGKISSFLPILGSNMRNLVTLRGVSGLWFFPCIFIAETIFFVSFRIRNGRRVAGVLSITLYLIAIVLVSNGYMPSMLFVLQRVCIGAGFFAAGFYCSKFIIKIDGCIQKSCGIVPTALWLALLLSWGALSLKNGMVSLVSLNLGNPILYTLAALLGALVMILFSSWLSARAGKRLRNTLITFGQNTVFVLGTHMFLVEIIRLLDYKICGDALKKLGFMEGIIFGGGVCAMLYLLIPLYHRIKAKIMR